MKYMLKDAPSFEIEKALGFEFNIQPIQKLLELIDLTEINSKFLQALVLLGYNKFIANIAIGDKGVYLKREDNQNIFIFNNYFDNSPYYVIQTILGRISMESGIGSIKIREDIFSKMKKEFLNLEKERSNLELFQISDLDEFLRKLEEIIMIYNRDFYKANLPTFDNIQKMLGQGVYTK